MESRTKQTVWTFGLIAVFAFILSVGALTSNGSAHRNPSYQVMDYPQAQ